MKLLIFINSLAGGGAERVTATLASHWARSQWEVTIVTLAPQALDFYPLEPAVRRIALDMDGDSAHALDALVRNGRRIRALRRTIRQLKPDVALSMMSTPNVLLAFASLGMTGLRTVGSERCYPPKFPLGRIWEALRSRMYGRLDAVVGLTRECAAWIRTHSSARRVPVIPNAVPWPLPAGTPRVVPDAVCGPGRKILLAAGRLSAEKGFDLLVDVYARLAPRHPDWDLVILGEGPGRRLLEAQVRDAALASRVFMPGIAGNLGEWYARAGLYALTSRFEGFPNALAEALAHGLPAVSFDCDTGPRDIVRHGIDGLLVPPQDARELERALDRVMGDAALRTGMAARAADARQRFSVAKIAAQWEELFAALSAPAAAASAPAASAPASAAAVPAHAADNREGA